jgi:hypothetical protein
MTGSVERRERGMANATSNLISDDFVLWMARFAEGAATEQSIRKRFRLDDTTWERLGADDALVERIDEIRRQRIADGTAARERAQQLFAGAPNVLGEILHGQAPPRVKVETAKELRAIAANGPGEAAPAARFEIIIDLGADVVESSGSDGKSSKRIMLKWLLGLPRRFRQAAGGRNPEVGEGRQVLGC